MRGLLAEPVGAPVNPYPEVIDWRMVQAVRDNPCPAPLLHPKVLPWPGPRCRLECDCKRGLCNAVECRSHS
jgi:hypothetical protein